MGESSSRQLTTVHKVRRGRAHRIRAHRQGRLRRGTRPAPGDTQPTPRCARVDVSSAPSAHVSGRLYSSSTKESPRLHCPTSPSSLLPHSNVPHHTGSPQPGPALASAVSSFGSQSLPAPLPPPPSTRTQAEPFDCRPPPSVNGGHPRPAVVLHAQLLPSSLRVTPSRQHRACITKFTSIPGSKDMQPIISSEDQAWAIRVKQTPGVKQDDCAVFRVNHYGGDVNRAYRAAVGHILTSRANRPLGDRGESCPICFGFHTLVGQACISPFIDWNAMIVSSHPLCPMCRGLHHAGYDCVNIK